jgi:hypothetical protein
MYGCNIMLSQTFNSRTAQIIYGPLQLQLPLLTVNRIGTAACELRRRLHDLVTAFTPNMTAVPHWHGMG